MNDIAKLWGDVKSSVKTTNEKLDQIEGKVEDTLNTINVRIKMAKKNAVREFDNATDLVKLAEDKANEFVAPEPRKKT